MSNKIAHESHSTKSELEVPSWLPKPKIGRPGRTLTGAALGRPTRPTTKRAEMRRERQPRTEKKHPKILPP